MCVIVPNNRHARMRNINYWRCHLKACQLDIEERHVLGRWNKTSLAQLFEERCLIIILKSFWGGGGGGGELGLKPPCIHGFYARV